MKKILLLTILALAFGSCKKDAGGSSNKSVTGLLTVGVWKFTTITADPATFPYVPSPTLVSMCLTDDSIIFKSGGVAQYDHGANCSPTPQTYNRQWLLSVDEKTITIEGGGQWTCYDDEDEVDWKIVSLTEDTLIVQYREECQGLGGYPWEITITFKH